MVVILWNILKVIGIVVLVVFAFLLLLMLLVLFSPICYQIAGAYTENVNGKFDIKWILGAIHAYGVYDKEGLLFSLRLFGYCVYGADKKQKKHKKDKKQEIYTEKDVMLSARSKEQYNLEQNVVEQQKEIQQKEEKEKQQKENKQEKEEQKHSRKKVTNLEKESKRNKKQKRENKKNRNKKKVKKEKQKKEKKIDKSYFLNMENKKELLKGILTFCKRMLKGVLPKHCYLKATVGTGDPALTGYIMAAFGIFKMKFGKGLEITGDFTQKIIKDVFLEIKGKILLGYLLYAALRLLFVKPVWQTIKVIWKGYR